MLPKICPTCKQNPIKKYRKYCSIICANTNKEALANRKKPPNHKITKICPCGIVFSFHKSHNKKYHNQQCFLTLSPVYGSIAHPRLNKVCSECRISFVVTFSQSWRKFCSSSCSATYKNKNGKLQITCPCGKKRITANSNTKWCNPKCYQKQYHKKHRKEIQDKEYLRIHGITREEGRVLRSRKKLIRTLYRILSGKKRIENHKLAIINDKNKWHRRRALYQKTDISDMWLLQLWQTTTICILCNKIMEDNGSYPNGKHLDHIIPLSLGGLHTMSNVRYICAECNCKRGNNIDWYPDVSYLPKSRKNFQKFSEAPNNQVPIF